MIYFERFEKIKKAEEFNRDELKESKILFDKLRLVNYRKTTARPESKSAAQHGKKTVLA